MDIEFQIHIPFLIDCAKSLRHSTVFKNSALQTLATCATREYLKGHIAYHNGVYTFIEGVKDLHNVVGNRISAKALVSLCESDANLRARVVAEVSPEI